MTARVTQPDLASRDGFLESGSQIESRGTVDERGVIEETDAGRRSPPSFAGSVPCMAQELPGGRCITAQDCGSGVGCQVECCVPQRNGLPQAVADIREARVDDPGVGAPEDQQESVLAQPAYRG